MEFHTGNEKIPNSEEASLNTVKLIWIRNQIVAPFSEEFSYRSCMMPLLLQCLPPTTAILVNPLFFGICKPRLTRKIIKI